MTGDVRMKITPLGDDCALLSFGNEVSTVLNARVRAIADSISADPFRGFIETVPAYSSLAVFYDPFSVPLMDDRKGPFESVKTIIERAAKDLSSEAPAPGREVEIPVAFGGDSGPDLDFVAEHNGISIDEAVKIFTSGVYLVYFLGFLPGFAYMGELDISIQTPRKETPRTMVPAGSIGIAGNQTGIYPLDSPGGWQIIGRTDLTLFDPEAEPPALLAPGDRVTFIARN